MATIAGLSSPVPLGSRVGSPFGPRGTTRHLGQDYPPPIPGQQGVPIYAIADGRVSAAGIGVLPGHSGLIVVIDHGGRVLSNYGHLATATVRAGDQGAGGQQIGVMGHTGNVQPAGPAGTHLHLGIRQAGVFIDPQAWLSRRGISPGTTPPRGRAEPEEDAVSVDDVRTALFQMFTEAAERSTPTGRAFGDALIRAVSRPAAAETWAASVGRGERRRTLSVVATNAERDAAHANAKIDALLTQLRAVPQVDTAQLAATITTAMQTADARLPRTEPAQITDTPTESCNDGDELL